MKRRLQNGSLFLMFLLFLCFSPNSSARLLPTKNGEEEIKLYATVGETNPLMEMDTTESLNLMGMEVCENGDEECLKRRIISEAHLDYIYTQHHKP